MITHASQPTTSEVYQVQDTFSQIVYWLRVHQVAPRAIEAANTITEELAILEKQARDRVKEQGY